MTDIEKFVKKILELQAEDENRPFTRDELRKIAESLGMSDDDWAKVQEEAADYRTRGTGYLRHGLWPEAVKEFEQALILLPGDVKVLNGLVEAYTDNYLDRRWEDDKRKAFDYATQCLDVQPDNESVFRQLEKIRNEEQAWVPITSPSRDNEGQLPSNPWIGPDRVNEEKQSGSPEEDRRGGWGTVLVILVILGFLSVVLDRC